MNSDTPSGSAIDPEIQYNLSLSVEERLIQHQQALDLLLLLEEQKLKKNEKSQ